jgi:hypothetical protein
LSVVGCRLSEEGLSVVGYRLSVKSVVEHQD